MPEAVLAALRDVPGAGAYLNAAQTRCVAGTGSAAALQRVAVIGAGTMGRDIALSLLLSGRAVVLLDPSAQALAAAEQRILATAEKRGVPVAEALSLSTDTDTPLTVDLVIEAVPERLDLKIQVLAAIAARVAPGTILATNTSTLDLDAIAVGVPNPSRVIGTHFFMPAHVTRLMELVPAKATAPEVLATAQALAVDLGKIPVVAGNCDGFIGNRLFDRLHQEAMYLVEDGAEPSDIDDALEAWGMKLGPLRTLDMIGNDIPWGVRLQRAETHPTVQHPLVGDRLCEAGLMGQKTGRGWYAYDAGDRRGHPHDAAREVALRASADLDLVRLDIGRDEILGRCLVALILEATRIVDEGMARAGDEVDLVYVTGYGFPAAVGGPLRLASDIGAAAVKTLADRYALASRHKVRWQVPEALAAILDTAKEPDHAL